MRRRSRLRLLSAGLGLAAAAVLLGCQPEGALDSAAMSVTVVSPAIVVAGWAWDEDAPTTPIDVHIHVDGHILPVKADLHRPDVAAAKPKAGPRHGYAARLSTSPGVHEVCVFAINAPGTAGGNVALGCRSVTVTKPPKAPAAAPTTTAPSTTTPPTTTPTTTTPPTTAPAAAGHPALVAELNRRRADAGLAALGQCASLDAAADAYARVLAANGWFDSVGPDGSEPWMRAEDYDGDVVGENLAFGYSEVGPLVEGTMSSDGQRSNVLAPEFTHVGAGRALGDPDGTGPLQEGYFWVVELGAGGSC
jgi:uncharacterized protein YkwD